MKNIRSWPLFMVSDQYRSVHNLPARAAMSVGELILYATEDGAAEIQLRATGGTVWLTQAQMADLFQTTPQAITQLINAIYKDGELQEEATCNGFLQVRTEGSRQVKRNLKHYNLDAILAVGYRVRSPRGVQFRRWATTTLREYLIKGFVLDDKRLKNPAWDYFDELLERIRDIRASEARFYRKVRDILALSEDYDPESSQVPVFYAKIQNKMLYAIAGGTAAELIAARADPELPNMGLTAWKGTRVRKGDVSTAKNYLGEPEIKELNLIVNIFLDTAEFRAKRRRSMRLADWEIVLDDFLLSNELPILLNAGSVSADQAERTAHKRYAAFDAKRREAERLAAGQEDDIEELERIAKISKELRKGKD